MKSKNDRRLAAIADLHWKKKSQDSIKNLLSAMASEGDILLLAGDLCDTGLIYPSEIACVPQEIRSKLFGRLKQEMDSPVPEAQSCRGPLLSRNQYKFDTMNLGYSDARLAPEGKPSSEEAASWTAAGGPAEEATASN